MNLFTLIIVFVTIIFSVKNNNNNVAFGTNLIPNGLSYNFYEKSCPQLENIVKDALTPVFTTDPTSAASLLRLMFHDCQVQGCDASIDMIKRAVEAECPRQVSCADIIVLAAREAVAISGGPIIEVPLGRRDSISASTSQVAHDSLPSADIGVDDALSLFANLGMTTVETVAIMGAHTLGVTHCLNIMDRLYHPYIMNNMDPKFETILRFSCPEFINWTRNTSFVLNDPSSLIFDNLYYSNSIKHRGVLRIDEELALNTETSKIVQRFAANVDDFFHEFESAFLKLSYARILTGNLGVIRSMCNFIDN